MAYTMLEEHITSIPAHAKVRRQHEREQKNSRNMAAVGHARVTAPEAVMNTTWRVCRLEVEIVRQAAQHEVMLGGACN